MKLILAIINRDDANAVTQSLTKAGFSSTKLSTTKMVAPPTSTSTGMEG